MYDEVIIGKPGQGKALHMMKSNTCDIK